MTSMPAKTDPQFRCSCGKTHKSQDICLIGSHFSFIKHKDLKTLCERNIFLSFFSLFARAIYCKTSRHWKRKRLVGIETVELVTVEQKQQRLPPCHTFIIYDSAKHKSSAAMCGFMAHKCFISLSFFDMLQNKKRKRLVGIETVELVTVGQRQQRLPPCHTFKIYDFAKPTKVLQLCLIIRST